MKSFSVYSSENAVRIQGGDMQLCPHGIPGEEFFSPRSVLKLGNTVLHISEGRNQEGKNLCKCSLGKWQKTHKQCGEAEKPT